MLFISQAEKWQEVERHEERLMNAVKGRRHRKAVDAILGDLLRALHTEVVESRSETVVHLPASAPSSLALAPSEVPFRYRAIYCPAQFVTDRGEVTEAHIGCAKKYGHFGEHVGRDADTSEVFTWGAK